MALFEFLGLLFACVSIITYFIGRYHARKELQGLESRLNYNQLKNLEILDRARTEGGKFKVRTKGTAGLDIPKTVSEEEQIIENVSAVLNNKKTGTKKIINSKGVIEKEKKFTTDSVFVLEEDTILCVNCGKPRHQHEECDYHETVGGPCDCPKFKPKIN